MYICATALLTCVSLSLFALAIKRHHRHAFGFLPPRSRVWMLRTAATITLCAAPMPWIAGDGLGMGLVTWLFCALPLLGLVVVLLLAYGPRRPDRLRNSPAPSRAGTAHARSTRDPAGHAAGAAAHGSQASSSGGS